MRVCFRFDASAWERREARHAVESVAALLESPVRLARPGEPPGSGEAPVYVGDPAAAPADAAAVIPVGAWEAWSPAELRVSHFEGAPLLCPGGAFAPPADGRELPGPWLRSIAFLLLREEERLIAHRDEWECFSGFSSRQHELGVLEQPLVNLYAAQLGRRVAAWCERRQVTLAGRPRWKDGARFAVALTHDVDWIRYASLAESARLLRQARGLRSYAFRAGLATALRALRRGLGANDPYWSFDRWAAAESGRGFRSTFFFCPPRPSRRHEYDATYRLDDAVGFEGTRVPLAEMLRQLQARGFELGLHGSYLSHRSGAELAEQKRQIGAACGAPLRGVRQHFLRFDLAATWSAQEQAGFVYDSTLGYNEALGFRAGIAAPFHPWDPGRGTAFRLLELPLTAMDGVLFRTLKLDTGLAFQRVREHLEAVERAGGLAVLLWHPNAADAEHFPGWWDCYAAVLDYLRTRPAWVATCGEVAEWWLAREAPGPGRG